MYHSGTFLDSGSMACEKPEAAVPKWSEGGK